MKWRFITIWHGAVEPVLMQSFFQKHGVEYESNEEKLFRGYITTRKEADVILSALLLGEERSQVVKR